MRYDNWKIVFMEQRCKGTMAVWGEPFTRAARRKLFNLRTDPYEFADITSNTYWEWFIRHDYIIFGPLWSVEIRGDFHRLPADPEAEQFTTDDAIEQMKAAGAGS